MRGAQAGVTWHVWFAWRLEGQIGPDVDVLVDRTPVGQDKPDRADA